MLVKIQAYLKKKTKTHACVREILLKKLKGFVVYQCTGLWPRTHTDGLKSRTTSQSAPTFHRLRHSTSTIFLEWHFPCLLPFTKSTFHCCSCWRGRDIFNLCAILLRSCHNTLPDEGKGLSSWQTSPAPRGFRTQRQRYIKLGTIGTTAILMCDEIIQLKAWFRSYSCLLEYFVK